MFYSILNWIDSLFYTTTLVTVVSKNLDPFSSIEKEEVILNETSVNVDHDQCIIDGRIITIPSIIKDRPTLPTNTSELFESYPNFRNDAIVVSFSNNDTPKSYINGMLISRSTFPDKKVREEISENLATTIAEVESQDHEFPVGITTYEDLRIVSYLTPTVHFLNISSENGMSMKIVIPAHFDTALDQSCLILAYTWARIVLLTFITNNLAITEYDEDALAITLVALIVSSRA